MSLRISQRANPAIYRALELATGKTPEEGHFDGPEHLRFLVEETEQELKRLSADDLAALCSGDPEVVFSRRRLGLVCATFFLDHFHKVKEEGDKPTEALELPDTTPFELTEAHEGILRHAVGAVETYRKSEWGFRNRYIASDSHDNMPLLLDLEREGLMKRGVGPNPGDFCFSVTESGCKALGLSRAATRRALGE